MAITDLTGTKWRLSGSPSEYPSVKRVELFCAVKSEDTNGVLRNYNFIELGRWPGPNTIPHFFTGETDNPGILRIWNNNEWIYANTSTGDLNIVCYFNNPIIEITGGAGATDSDTIAWFEANATPIYTPDTGPFLSKIGLSRVWQNIQTHLNKMQEKLVSGTNIKTVNNQSLLGSGNLDIGGGTVDTAMSDTSENAVQNKVIKSYIDGKAGFHVAVGQERWVGTYTDENNVTYQVYSKQVYIPALPATAGITKYEHGIDNIKQILDIYGSTTDGFVLNAPRQTVTDNITIYQASKSASNKTFSIEVGKDRSSKKAYVTVIYAKNN